MELLDRFEKLHRPVSLQSVFRRFGKAHLLSRRSEKRRKKPEHLKLAFFTDTYLPNVDGVVSSIVSFKEELEKRGDRVYVFSSGSRQDKRDNSDRRVHFYTSVKFPPYPQYKLALFPFSPRKQVKKAKADLVHSHAMTSMAFAAIVAAKELRLPLVGTFHTLIPNANRFISRSRLAQSLFSKFAWRAIRELYRPFDLVIAPSRTAERLLNEHGVTSTALVPNGVDAERFSPKNDGNILREALRIPEGGKVILACGRLSFEKNVDVLIRAAKLVLEEEDATFVIQGDGPAKSSCMKLARQLNVSDKMVFTGFVKRLEVPYFYAASDVVATASTFETQGLTLLEAMASGKICVGADSLAIPEVLRHKRNGFLFEPFNEEDCAEKLLAALTLAGRDKERMQENARKTALSLTTGKCTDRLLRAYGKVL